MLEATAVLGGYDRNFGDIRLREVTEAALVSIAIPLDGEATAAKALSSAYALELPPVGFSAASETHRLIRTSLDQGLLLFDDPLPLAEPEVRAALQGACYTTNQTDAWVVLSIEGPDVRAALERLCPLDLHPDVFAIGAAERTVMEHMSAFIARTAENRFLILTASSSARSMLDAVELSLKFTRHGKNSK